MGEAKRRGTFEERRGQVMEKEEEEKRRQEELGRLMSDPQAEVCKNCQQWKEKICRRFPPQVVIELRADLLNPNQAKQVPISYYPMTEATTKACGEFKLRVN